MSDTITKITIEGFKSIRKLEDFELRPLNVLIGANGAGKSNFVEFFRLLRELVDQRLQLAVAKAGGPNACLYLGPKITQELVAKVCFASYDYKFVLVPTQDDRLVFEDEELVNSTQHHIPTSLGSTGRPEAKIREVAERDYRASGGRQQPTTRLYDTVSSWVAYHFHDTSAEAAVRRPGPINHNEHLHADGGNLAAYLFRISRTSSDSYAKIRDVVRLAAPFFDDFRLRPDPTNEEQIRLEWRQKDSRYAFLANQLSDGTLRFICLATALLQPSLPPTVLFDEPELGLHPYALSLLAGLFQQAAPTYESFVPNQVIVSTQSAPLLNEFAPENVIVVQRARGESFFQRLASAQLAGWLEEYTLGELWQKNVLGGRPRNEEIPLPPDGDRDGSAASQEEESSAGDQRS